METDYTALTKMKKAQRKTVKEIQLNLKAEIQDEAEAMDSEVALVEAKNRCEAEIKAKTDKDKKVVKDEH